MLQSHLAREQCERAQLAFKEPLSAESVVPPPASLVMPTRDGYVALTSLSGVANETSCLKNHAMNELIDEYLRGPALLKQAVAGMNDAQLDARPQAGKWSTREVIAHIADFEPVYADRMKRAIAEDNPTVFGGDPDLFLKSLAYGQRNVDEELCLIDCVRKQMARILRTLPSEAFQRTAKHSVDGPLTIETLLRRITGHIPHHLTFIQEKRNALGL